MKKLINCLILLVILFSSVTVNLPDVQAQARGDWTSPYRLSTDKSKAAEATLITDRYGYVHAFWAEEKEDTRSTIQYARYDGERWTIPNDLHVTPPDDKVNSITAALDKDSTIHLIWTEGFEGRSYYMSAPSYDALSAKNWTRSLRLDLRGSGVDILRIDSKGIFHLIYAVELGNERGVYYVRSSNQGLIWSVPIWLDLDIPSTAAPASVQFEIDENDGLHVVWYYLALDLTGGDWVRYTHSLDGGETWSDPFTIDKLTADDIDEEDGDSKTLSAANPRMAIVGETVHIIWAGGRFHYRNHRYSTNAGITWSQATRVFDDLNGQAGDGFAVDGDGNVHFFSQIRFPQGIYHMVWKNNSWSTPSLIYLISRGDGDLIGDRIHAHRTYPIIRAGNEVLVTFTDPPPTEGRRLFVMERVLEDVSPLPIEPVPQPTEQAEINQVAVATAEPVETPLPSEFHERFEGASVTSSNTSIWFGMIASLVVILGVAVSMSVVKRRSRDQHRA